MRKAWADIGILLAVVALFLGGCSTGPAADPEEMQLRTYTVPQGFEADQIRDYLRRSMDTGEQNLGTVNTYPDGSLVVAAPRSVHAGIEELLKQLERRGPAEPAPAPSTVTVKYWLLLGRQQESGGLTVSAPSLRQDQALRPVLEEIVKAQGGMEFHLLEQLQLSSLDNGSGSTIRGRRASAEQRVSRHDSSDWLADIRLSVHGTMGLVNVLESRIKLKPDRFVVLGQTAFNDKGIDLSDLSGDADDDLMLYYVISSEID